MKNSIIGLMGVCAVAFALEAKAVALTNTVSGTCVGDVQLVCAKPGDWTFDIVKSSDKGRDVVTVLLSASAAQLPPSFEVQFETSGKDVTHVWTPSEKEATLWPVAWGLTRYQSQLAKGMPIMVALNENDEARLAVGVSEALRQVRFGLTVHESKCTLLGRFKFFTAGGEVPMAHYAVSILLDRRGTFWGDAVQETTAWICNKANFTLADVPEAARDPLYSTWYAYWQDVRAESLEREAQLAAKLGMKTMILDDGWQKEDACGGEALGSFYAYTGDWMPSSTRFPDMKGHVAKVHAAGLKYMLWLAVPYMGNRAKNYARFKGMYLRDAPPEKGPGVCTLDPRFKEVREYLVQTYERVVGEWGFDGVKLDFIDQFVIYGGYDPAAKENYKGRDIRSLPEAVNVLMKEVLNRLKKINPNVLVEFRQWYMGPAIRQYGNMIRVADCPADPAQNRRGICDLRLTSGKTAVHSDMLVWSREETAEGAARPILSALFGVIQYSMILQGLPECQNAAIRHWLAFSEAHRGTLLDGAFHPHHPELGYPIVEAESAAERIVAVYANNLVADAGKADKKVYIINASQRDGVVTLCAAAPKGIRAFDATGKEVSVALPPAGVSTIAIPKSGYAQLVW